MLDIKTIKENANTFKKIYFFRVCGTGMGAAACLLREKGYEVEGGDYNFYPPMSDYLIETKIPLNDLNNYDKSKLNDFDLIVVGNVVPRNSEDAKFIESLDVPYCSFPAALGALVLSDINVVGIAGTHGKTTTTYYLTQILESLGEKPGYLVGGVIEGRPSALLGDGKYFVIESDEYDSAYFEKISKFRSYSINDLILTSLEYDHADIFDSVEDIKNEFRHLLKEIPGEIIYNSDYKAARELQLEFSDIDWTSYSEDIKKTSAIDIIKSDENGTSFKLIVNDELMSFNTNLIGTHNLLNLSSCILFCQRKGFSIKDIQKSILNLKHVKRRQEIRGEYKGALVIDDFAHHPRSVGYTIEGIKTNYPGKKVIVVLEPNSATARSNIFQNEFAEALSHADEVIMAKASRNTTAKNAENLDYQKIVDSLLEMGKKSCFVTDLDALRKGIDEGLSGNSILLVLSNGTCLDLWKSDFVDQIV
jgi:UDP-N-acetylmuramate: L-alanyl-gamma-D-glutamyl-meso-diaminopimelate ligase